MSAQTGKQAITIDLLPDISKSKGSQTMKFSQLIEYNVRNIQVRSGSSELEDIFKKINFKIYEI